MLKFVLLLSLAAPQAFAFIDYKSKDSGELTSIFDGPEEIALGGAGLAAKSATESSHLNPATLPLLKGSNFGFVYSAESLGPRTGSNKYHVVASEADEEVAFPGAVSYSRVGFFKNGQNTDLQEFHMAGGTEISDYVSLGLALKYLTLESQNLSQQSAFNSTMGILVAPNPNLGIALVFDDMFDTQDIPMNSTLGLGAQYVFPHILRVRGDIVEAQRDNPDRKPIVKTGLESLFLGHDINLRMGYRWDQMRAERFFAMGLGWQGPRLGLNYAYEKNALSEDYRHLIDLLMQF